MSKRIALFPALLLALLVIAATALTWMNFSQALPRSQWAQAAWAPDWMRRLSKSWGCRWCVIASCS